MSKRIVIALGGNALGNTPYEQLALVTETAKPIVDLIAQGNEVIIAHGNGDVYKRQRWNRCRKRREHRRSRKRWERPWSRRAG